MTQEWTEDGLACHHKPDVLHKKSGTSIADALLFTITYKNKNYEALFHVLPLSAKRHRADASIHAVSTAR